MACGSCAEKAQREGPKDSHAAFTRALLFGVGGALLGLIAYATFAIINGLVIGYLSLAVGYVVAKAMMLGSSGIGGRRYQIAAITLTYAAVSMAAIPVWISYIVQHKGTHHQVQTQQPAHTDQPSAEPQQQTTPKLQMSFGTALLQLALLGLASPFLELQADPFSGIIGLIILLVGIRIAWKMTAGQLQTIDGPFAKSPAAR